MQDTVLIAGAGQAAAQAIISLRHGGYGGRIILAGEEPYLPYQRPPLSKKFLAGGLEAERLQLRPERFYQDNGIELRLGSRVEAIDPAGRTARIDGDTLRYDKLILATGSQVRRIPVPGQDLPHVHYLRTIDDVRGIQQDFLPGRRMVVIGGGYIGLEMAEALVSRGLNVTLIEMLEQPMATLDPDMGERVADALHELGVSVHLGVTASGFEVDDDGWVRAVATSEGEFPAELVVLGLGFRPNVSLAVGAGVPIGPSGAIAVDARMATRTPHVWAAGDCVESLNRISGAPVWVALGTHANKQGRTAGTNLSGTPARFEGVIGTAITRVGEVEIARTGLSSREAQAAGFAAVANTIEAGTRAHYYPGSEKLAVRVVVERGTGRMLGAQIVGGPESGKRIDALAVGVWNGMTAVEFSGLDLAYAPPFAPVWDAILIAARLAGEKAVG